MINFNINYEFLRIPTPENPWTGLPQKNKKIYTDQQLISLFPKDSLKILDLGCGYKKFKSRPEDNVIGIDHTNKSDADIVTDISKGLPFDDCEVDFVYCSHFVEHLSYEERDIIFYEIKRVLKRGGLFFFKVPHFSHYFISAYDHKIWNYGCSTAYTLANGSWYSHVPFFQPVSIGINYKISKNSLFQNFLNFILNRSFRISEAFLLNVLGGAEEIQYLLAKPLNE